MELPQIFRGALGRAFPRAARWSRRPLKSPAPLAAFPNDEVPVLPLVFIAGGLGGLAVRYGYQRRVTSMMVVTVIFIIILVQVIQSVFSWLSTKLDKRLR